MELFSDLISDLIILVATQRGKQRQSTSLVIRARFFWLVYWLKISQLISYLPTQIANP